MGKKIHPESAEALVLLQKTMIAGNYSVRSIATYLREVRYICAYYPELPPAQWTDLHIIDYMTYQKTVHQVSYSKSKMTAQSVAFFYVVLQPICSMQGLTFIPSRNCWVIATSRPRWFTFTFRHPKVT
jgi:hypothetical protein